ncbi:hypothetical protein ACHAXT_012897 [Thalassiosira profunda]
MRRRRRAHNIPRTERRARGLQSISPARTMAPTDMKIKKEDVYEDADASPPSVERPEIEALHLTRVKPDLARDAELTKYPPGCPVLCHLESSCPARIAANQGCVKSVYFHISDPSRVYKVLLKTTGEGKASSPQTVYCWEDELAFDLNAPIYVKGLAEDKPTKEARVLGPMPGQSGGAGSYAIRFTSEGGQGAALVYEYGVSAERITYRYKTAEKTASSPTPAEEANEGSEKKADESAEAPHDEPPEKELQDGGQHDHEEGFATPIHTNCTAQAQDTATEESLLENGNDKNTSRNDANHEAIARENNRSPNCVSINAAMLSSQKEPSTGHPPAVEHPEDHHTPKPRPIVNAQTGRWEPPPVSRHSSTNITSRSHDLAVPRKRQLTQDTGDDAPLSKRPKIAPPSGCKVADVAETVLSCILTVPSWVLKRCGHGENLKGFLLGYGGKKLQAIKSESNCHRINLAGGNGLPMKITIESWRFKTQDKGQASHSVRMAIQFITKSILEFIQDPSSARRLTHDLAWRATGTSKFWKQGGAILVDKNVWARILDLRPGDFDFLLSRKEHDYLTRDTRCWLEVHNSPALTCAYVFIGGSSSHDVNRVAEKITNRMGRR